MNGSVQLRVFQRKRIIEEILARFDRLKAVDYDLDCLGSGLSDEDKAKLKADIYAQNDILADAVTGNRPQVEPLQANPEAVS